MRRATMARPTACSLPRSGAILGFVARRGIGYDATLPPEGPTPEGDEDYVSPEERAEAIALFKPASRQRVADEAEERAYLRLVDEFEASRPEVFFTGPVVAAAFAAVAIGVVAGLAWRKRRAQAKAGVHGFSRLELVRSPCCRGLDVVLSSL